MLLNALTDACIDSLKLLPFLFLTYLFMEWLEHGAGQHFEQTVARSGKAGPAIGAVLGVIPQCGFSGAAATLYAGRVITLGTLISVFLATSDEMLPIMISEAAPLSLIAKVLAIKVACGILIGFVLDAVLRATGRSHAGLASKHAHEGHEGNDIHVICEQEGCECAQACDCCSGSCALKDEVPTPDEHERGYEHECEHNHAHEHDHSHGHTHSHAGHINWGHLAWAALRHSLQIIVFVFIICLLINIVFEVGEQQGWQVSLGSSALAVPAAALLGLIPNCAVSVGMTELYLDGVLGGGALISGLLVNAGIGLLVLLRTNNDSRENLRICGVLVACGLVVGFLVQALGVL